MKTFNDLEFNLTNMVGGARAELNFPNGYGASVLRGDGTTFSRTAGGTYELAVLKGDRLCYDTHITDDVLNWQTKEQINVALKSIQQLVLMIEHLE
jgi:hypothetical protein